MQYSYPIDESWSTEEIIIVVEFLSQIEKAYQTGVGAQNLLMQYKKFKQVVPSMSEEKTIDRTFEQGTGYSIYRTIKEARANKEKKVKM